MRRTPALVTLAALLAAGLAACSPVASGDAGCRAPFPAGGASELVEVSGGLGEAPRIDFPTPLIAREGQVSPAIAGAGRQIQAGDTVDVEYSIATGEDGVVRGDTGYDGNASRLRAGDADLGLAQALECARVGDRLVYVTPIDDGFGQGAGAQAGLAAGATVVVIIDVIDAYLAKADGVNQLPQDGMPTVVTAVDGQPGITFPGGPPPERLRIATIKAGSGAKVRESDEIVVHYTGWIWPEDGAEPTSFQSSWTSGLGTGVTLQASEDALIPGFAKAVVGASVGSQVLAVIPPGEGYPAGENPQAIPEGSTLVFVIDILGIRAADAGGGEAD